MDGDVNVGVLAVSLLIPRVLYTSVLLVELAILWYVGLIVEKASEFPITSSETTEEKRILQDVIECESFIVASSIDMFECIIVATKNI